MGKEYAEMLNLVHLVLLLMPANVVKWMHWDDQPAYGTTHTIKAGK
jgi:hypothetical protein